MWCNDVNFNTVTSIDANNPNNPNKVTSIDANNPNNPNKVTSIDAATRVIYGTLAHRRVVRECACLHNI
jgi:hypothetical protein